jgi:hypothetical protein
VGRQRGESGLQDAVHRLVLGELGRGVDLLERAGGDQEGGALGETCFPCSDASLEPTIDTRGPNEKTLRSPAR